MAALLEKSYGGDKLPSLVTSPTPKSIGRSPTGSAKSTASLPKLVLKAYGTAYSNSLKKKNRATRRKSLTTSSEKSKLPKLLQSDINQNGVSRENHFDNYSNLRGRERCIYLAEPKTNKTIWLTSVGPKLVWGNQETMWPISPAALEAESSKRVEELSVPKKNFRHTLDGNERIHVFSCGRNSVIWDVSPLAMKTEPSDRIVSLAQTKSLPPLYQEDRAKHSFSCGRESPVWTVSDAAQKAKEKDRLEQLARPKTPHRDYELPRQVESLVSDNAKKGRASARVEQLARPKSRPHGPFREPKWPVSPTAKQATASTRQIELSKPKGVADGFLPARSTLWEVRKSALRAHATSRTHELSKPIERATMDHVQFNPDAFIVSEAEKARCPPRIEELSQPLNRN
ncbi:putative testicular haploid expressed protein-like isoform X2 [Apostichopus japonicus]|uniref:Putative testicular haploid expressed protein-like isoform X2 n=1 Tax=Stichopus japonicus TaxID=307972 RepID=A0A2G8KLI2_STIJA|nr:putative testicular haploid expressed protein-like isoform X2 [Apostichopus japonicus]